MTPFSRGNRLNPALPEGTGRRRRSAVYGVTCFDGGTFAAGACLGDRRSCIRTCAAKRTKEMHSSPPFRTYTKMPAWPFAAWIVFVLPSKTLTRSSLFTYRKARLQNSVSRGLRVYLYPGSMWKNRAAAGKGCVCRTGAQIDRID